MLKKLFQQEGYDFTEKAVAGVSYRILMRVENADDIYANIGSGHFAARDIFRTIFPGHKTEIAKTPEDEKNRSRHGTRPRRRASRCRSRGLSPAWPCISRAAATRCRATGLSGS
jgi:guanosine-3',5'-bis(diphosphate) 3'-pyrophosphohydrolase